MVGIPKADENLKDPLCQEKSGFNDLFSVAGPGLGEEQISLYMAAPSGKVSCIMLCVAVTH